MKRHVIRKPFSRAIQKW